jgi:hypothetical protein
MYCMRLRLYVCVCVRKCVDCLFFVVCVFFSVSVTVSSLSLFVQAVMFLSARGTLSNALS